MGRRHHPPPGFTGRRRLEMSETDDNDVETVEGGDAGDSSPRNDEVKGLLAALHAERQKRQSLETKFAEVSGKVDALSQKPAKEFTRAELQARVDEGNLTQAEADRIYEDQLQQKVTADVTKKVESSAEQKALAQRIGMEIQKYVSVLPDIEAEGSENRGRVTREYQRLVSLGYPDNVQTELTALMAAFGPPELLSKGREKQKETYQGVGSDGGETSQKEAAPKLPAHVKTHYSKMIEKGMYEGWDDPNLKKEIGDYGRW